MRILTLVSLFALAATLTARQPAPKAEKTKAEPKRKSDQELIQGTWVVVGLESGGKAQPDKSYRGNTFTFTRDRATLKEGNYPSVDFTFVLDPTKDPKAIDLAAKNAPVRGIYKLEGDDLTLCLSLGTNRPTGFATKAGGDGEVFVLRRSRWERLMDRGAGLSVEMPGRPEVRQRDTPVPGGPSVTTVRVVRSEMEPATYLVAVTPLPDGADRGRAGREAVLAAALAEAAPAGKTSVESDKEFKTESKGGGYAGRELELALDVQGSAARLVVRARQFVAADRMYVLLVVGTEEGVKAANVSRFWGSFRLVAEKR